MEKSPGLHDSRGLALLLSRPDLLERDAARSPAPYDENGLALLPTETGCIGSDCFYSSDEFPGECYEDEHHIYHYKEVYEADGVNSLTFRIRQQKFGRLLIARCRHDQIHEKHGGMPIPPEDNVRAFLGQARKLTKFCKPATALACSELDLSIDTFTPIKHRPEKSKRKQNECRSNVDRLRPDLAKLALLPKEALEDPVRFLHPKAPEAVRIRVRELLVVA